MMMSSRSAPSDRLRILINEARLSADDPNSSPSIAHNMLAKFRGRIKKEGLEERLIAIGLNKEIREFLKQEREDTSPSSADQVDMWPEALRPLIRDIDRERVYVPSLGNFVRIIPDEISSQQAEEAGEYLVVKGTETIRVGKLLIRLARML